ncbi:MAG: DsbA family protein [Phenylobacterium sp.]|jgi:putative protein-disulfide isomerase|uniref:DsbA family protein n=1 Tax=Phenylobacterium sp. TaxID=1871053 RepID=UPI002A275131|nr:DsbA family protein [Phenylobacterium sp.]MDD3838491.1 DsbA family protein [Phenylobacterium sp.]MDX9999293.1 DsbA family protein [Phenylobacterium sp.]
MDGRHLIYFADPMCSWCYGFGPVMDQVAARYGERLPIQLVMGGLRPGTDRPMTPEARAELLSHWEHVREATGQPFDEQVLTERFVYDTDPAARAVVLVRRLLPSRALAFLHRVQRAFYAEARDVTSYPVLAELAAEFGLPADGVQQALSDERLMRETWGDYALSQNAGVTGFPTLVGGPNEAGVYGVVTRGCAPADQILRVLDEWLERSEPEV